MQNLFFMISALFPSAAPTQAELRAAIMNNDLAHVQTVLNAGVNPNGIHGSHAIPLNRAILPINPQSNHFRDPEIIRTLLAAGAHVDGNQSEQPLFRAIDHNNYEAVEILLAAGAQTIHHTQKPALHYAVGTNNIDERIVACLLKRQLDPNELFRSFEIKSPLCYATTAPIAQLLIKAGANPNAQRVDHCSPLMTAFKHKDVFRYLLVANARTNRKKIGRTLLHDAQLLEDFIFTKMLLTYGANPNIKDNNNSLPLDHALLNDRLQSACVLLQSGAWFTQQIAMTDPLLYEKSCMLVKSGLIANSGSLQTFLTFDENQNLLLLSSLLQGNLTDFIAHVKTAISGNDNTMLTQLEDCFIIAHSHGMKKESYFLRHIYSKNPTLISRRTLCEALYYTAARGHHALLPHILKLLTLNPQSLEAQAILSRALRAAVWGMWHHVNGIDFNNPEHVTEMDQRREIITDLTNAGAPLIALRPTLFNAILDNNINLTKFLMSLNVPIDMNITLMHAVRDCLRGPVEFLLEQGAPLTQTFEFLRTRRIKKFDASEKYYSKIHLHPRVIFSFLEGERRNNLSYLSLLPQDLLKYLIAPMTTSIITDLDS